MKYLLLLLVVGCGRASPVLPQPSPDPMPAVPFAGHWGGMLEGFRQCGDGSGSNTAIPSTWRVADTDGGLVITGTECGTLTATMTPDGGKIAAGSCGDSLLRGGTLTLDTDGMQARLDITDADGCAGYDIGLLQR